MATAVEGRSVRSRLSGTYHHSYGVEVCRRYYDTLPQAHIHRLCGFALVRNVRVTCCFGLIIVSRYLADTSGGKLDDSQMADVKLWVASQMNWLPR